METKELKELSLSIWDRLRRAVNEGDKAQTNAIIDELERNVGKGRADIAGFVNLALEAIAQGLGEDAVNDVVRKFAEGTVWSIFGQDTVTASPEEKLRRRAYVCTSKHDVAISIEEDEDKFTIKFPCSTGVALNKRSNIGRLKGTHPWACGEKGICLYCTHCVLAFEVMAMERFGDPWWIVSPPKKPGDACMYYIYKDTAKIPDEYYQRAGKKRLASVNRKSK